MRNSILSAVAFLAVFASAFALLAAACAATFSGCRSLRLASRTTVPENIKVVSELDQALHAMDEALVVASERVASRPDANEWLYRLAVTSSYRGMVQEEQGRHDAAVASYRTGLTHTEELARREPGNTRWSFEAELNHARLGHAFEPRNFGDSASGLCNNIATLMTVIPKLVL